MVRRTKEGRKVVPNEDGSVSTEISVTVQDPRLNNGLWTNIPSMFNGRRVSDDEAVEIILRNGGKDPETGRVLSGFQSFSEAIKAAEERSESLGRGL
jgi:hypothetical protein